MARVEINLPHSFIFTTRIPIRIGDINRAHHLSHVNLVQILEEARAQFISDRGFGNEVTINQGMGFILGDLSVIFKGQAYYGQTLQIEMAATEFKEKSFDIVYRVTATDTGEEIARAKTGLLTFDYQKQKVVKIPDDLKSKLLS